MAGKKQRRRKISPAARKFEKIKHKHRAAAGPLQQSVLRFLEEQNKPVSLAEIFAALHLGRKERSTLVTILENLTNERVLQKKKKRFSLASGRGYVLATLVVNRKGFGFATEEGQQPKDKDIFIGARNLNGASHGDTVQISIIGKSRGKREGRVVKVITRAITSLCGFFTDTGQGGYVTPDNERLPYTVQIEKGKTAGAADGTVVQVDLIDYGSEHKEPSGKIVEIMGDPYDAMVQIKLAILEHSLRDTFSQEVLAEAERLVPVTTCDEGRKDLRHIPHVTIDGADARDFDDAISVEKTEQGFILYVSIADVSHYVAPGTPLDREAFLRGTSVYLPDRVLPMLPERLSNNLCSLVPHEPRPAFTAILSFDSSGKRTGERYRKSLIQSCQRFTYETVNEILYKENKELQQQHTDLLPMLHNAKELTALLNVQRMNRGSLGFNIPEPLMKIDREKITTVTLSQRNQAHILIEECMLAANEAVAETLSTKDREVLFRIHEDPDQAKLENFSDVCKMLGVQLPKTKKDPAWFAAILAKTTGTQVEYVINNLLLRSMQQARYSPENRGHFGLAAEHYLHFTSPIRRYPDLIAHRALQALLGKEERPLLFPDHEKQLPLVEAGKRLSQCERKAIDVSRNVHARLAVLFLKDRIGDQFAAIISGVTPFGLFIELQEYYISGGVPLKEMRDDYYLHDAKRHRLIGERTNKILQLGDMVEVVLEHADIFSKRLTFALVTVNNNRT